MIDSKIIKRWSNKCKNDGVKLLVLIILIARLNSPNNKIMKNQKSKVLLPVKDRRARKYKGESVPASFRKLKKTKKKVGVWGPLRNLRCGGVKKKEFQ